MSEEQRFVPEGQMPEGYRLWIEGDRYVEFFDEATRKKLAILGPLLRELGFIPMTQRTRDKAIMGKRRRSWPAPKVTLAFAASKLAERAAWLISDYRKELYPLGEQNDVYLKLAKTRTYTMIHRLDHELGILERFYHPTGEMMIRSKVSASEIGNLFARQLMGNAPANPEPSPAPGEPGSTETAEEFFENQSKPAYQGEQIW